MKWFERARLRLKEKGLTQDDLVADLNVSSRSSVGHYFCGRREPSFEQLLAIAKKLDCSVDWLLTGENSIICYNEKPRPPVISDEQWKALSPTVRIFVEDLLLKCMQNVLDDNAVRLLQNMVDALTKNNLPINIG